MLLLWKLLCLNLLTYLMPASARESLLNGRGVSIGPNTTSASKIEVPHRLASKDGNKKEPKESIAALNAERAPTLNSSSIFNQMVKGGNAGAFAGVIQIVTLMWLRTTTNYQYRYNIPMGEAVKRLYQEGGIARFYKGLIWALVQGPASKFGSVAANELALALVSRHPHPRIRLILAAPLGSFFSSLWRFFLMPIDTCKTVLQVEGSKGFDILIHEILKGKVWLLYQSALATLLTTFSGHLPWFLVFNILDAIVAKPTHFVLSLLRHSSIGFFASLFSDLVSNPVRVIKILKQTAITEGVERTDYVSLLRNAISDGGVSGLFFRGIGSRIMANGMQSIIFVVAWKILRKRDEQIQSNTR